MILQSINKPSNLILTTLNSALSAIRNNTSESFDLARAVLHLVAHLEQRRKQTLIFDVLGSVLKQNGKETPESVLFSLQFITSQNTVRLLTVVAALLAEERCPGKEGKEMRQKLILDS